MFGSIKIVHIDGFLTSTKIVPNKYTRKYGCNEHLQVKFEICMRPSKHFKIGVFRSKHSNFDEFVILCLKLRNRHNYEPFRPSMANRDMLCTSTMRLSRKAFCQSVGVLS